MIASNQHGEPSLAPDRAPAPMLTLPDFYLDLMFGDLPDPRETDPSPAEQQRDPQLAVAAT